ncbi:MAG: hypothetical protein U0105_26285 [Candidatus Obscuribacterales bacterium]
MNEDFNLEPSIEPVTTSSSEAGADDEDDADATTGLLWPKTWKGAYALVLCSFLLWVVSLIAVSEVFK